MISWWWLLVVGFSMLIATGITTFIVAQKRFEKQLKDNPPINANQIRAMYRQMGRTPTEKQVRQTMNAMKNAGKK